MPNAPNEMPIRTQLEVALADWRQNTFAKKSSWVSSVSVPVFCSVSVSFVVRSERGKETIQQIFGDVKL